MDQPEVMGSLPQLITNGLAVLLAVSLALNKLFESQRNERTQVTIITEDRDAWRERAQRAQQEGDEIRAKLNNLIFEQSELKAQSTVMLEQLESLRRENHELTQRLERFMRVKDVGSNQQAV